MGNDRGRRAVIYCGGIYRYVDNGSIQAISFDVNFKCGIYLIRYCDHLGHISPHRQHSLSTRSGDGYAEYDAPDGCPR
ncbi:hypothetical protein D3C73_1379650 [compost metagenome]